MRINRWYNSLEQKYRLFNVKYSIQMEDILKAVKGVDMSTIHEKTRHSMLKRGRDEGTAFVPKKARTNQCASVSPSTAGSSTEADTS